MTDRYKLVTYIGLHTIRPFRCIHMIYYDTVLNRKLFVEIDNLSTEKWVIEGHNKIVALGIQFIQNNQFQYI